MNAPTKTPMPEPRANFVVQSPELLAKLAELNAALGQSSIEPTIRELVAIRTSQMNGCSFCLDMHVKAAKILGERELRIYHVAAWRESELFAPRERAALAWAEVLTRLPDGGVPDELYARVRTQLSEKEVSDLTFVVGVSNLWNRLSVASKTKPGSADAKYGLEKAGLK